MQDQKPASEIRFDGQVVLVTGAGRGLGRAYAARFAERSARVIVHDAGVAPDGSGHDPCVADAVVDEIRQAGGLATAAYEDLSSRRACRALIDRIEEEHGRLDVLVHNAGIVLFRRLDDLDAAAWERTRRVNIEAPLWLSQAALPLMKRRRYGRLVMTVSGHGLVPSDVDDLPAYSISKAAQFGLMNGLIPGATPAGIHINAISPVAATRIYRHTVGPGEYLPAHVVPGVLFLASSRCAVSGVVLRASNGRFSIGRFSGAEGVDFGRAPVSPEAIAAWWDDLGTATA